MAVLKAVSTSSIPWKTATKNLKNLDLHTSTDKIKRKQKELYTQLLVKTIFFRRRKGDAPNGFGEALLLVTSEELLQGGRVSGGTPKVEWVNPRWSDNGDFLRDKASTLHGKVIKTLESGVVHPPGPELLAVSFVGVGYDEVKTVGYLGPLCRNPLKGQGHLLKKACEEVLKELSKLHQLSVMMDPGKEKSYRKDVYVALVAKFKAAGVQRFSDIPASLTLTAKEIAPELWANKDMLGKVEIPGIGFKTVTGWESFTSYHGGRWIKGCPSVELTLKEIRQVTSWPHSNLLISIPEVGVRAGSLNVYEQSIFFSGGEDRWAEILGTLLKKWSENHERGAPGVPEPPQLDDLLGHLEDQDPPGI